MTEGRRLDWSNDETAWQTVLDDALTHVQAEFAANGGTLPLLVIVGDKDPETGDALDEPEVFVMEADDESDPVGQMLALAEQVGDRFGARATAVVAECWTHGSSEDPSGLKSHLAAGGSIKDFPGATEALVCFARSKSWPLVSGHRVFIASIDRSGDRASAGDFVERPDGSSMSGRLTDILYTLVPMPSASGGAAC